MEKCYKEAVKEVLGKKKSNRKPWLSETTLKLVDQRADTNKKIMETHSERLKKRLQEQCKEQDRNVKKQARNDKKQWTARGSKTPKYEKTV